LSNESINENEKQCCNGEGENGGAVAKAAAQCMHGGSLENGSPRHQLKMRSWRMALANRRGGVSWRRISVMRKQSAEAAAAAGWLAAMAAAMAWRKWLINNQCKQYQ